MADLNRLAIIILLIVATMHQLINEQLTYWYIPRQNRNLFASRRTAISGFVSRPLTACIIRERMSAVTVSTILAPRVGGHKMIDEQRRCNPPNFLLHSFLP
jgi:hypothetical protein